MSAPAPSPSARRKKQYNNNDEQIYDFGQYMLYLFPIGIFAGFIAWWRNSQSNIIMRIIYVLLAYVFNIFYLIYIVYRWFTYKPPAPVSV